MRRLPVLVLPLLVGALALTSCGGDDDSGTAAATTIPADAVTVHAADINFPQKDFTAKAGTVTFVYIDQPGVTKHTLSVEGIDKSKFYLEINGAGDKAVGSVQLAAGTYTIFCDVPGHRQAGMEAHVTVS